MTDTSAISRDVQAYILQEFLPDENPDNLNESTSLIRGGILDSIGILKLMSFLEDKYGIQIKAHETAHHFKNISNIAKCVQSKLAGG